MKYKLSLSYKIDLKELPLVCSNNFPFYNNLEYLDQKLDRLHPYFFTSQLSKCKESKDTANNYEDTGNMTALISGKNNFVAKGELDKLDILQSLKRNEKIIFKTDTKEECFSHCSLE